MFIKNSHLILLLIFFNIPSLNASIVNKVNLKNNNIENEINKNDLNEIIDSEAYIDLDNLKSILIENNKELKILKSKIEQSNANYKSKLATWLPRFYVNSNELPNYAVGNDYNNINNDTSTDKLSVGANANLDWDIVKPNRRLEIKVANEELINSKNIYKSKINDLYLESVKLYYYIQASYQEISLAKKSIEISNIALSEAEAKYKAGIGNKLELLEAKTQLDRDQIKLINKIGELNKNKNSINLILNADQKYNFKEDNESLINWIWDKNFEDSLLSAYKNRIDLKVKNQNISINEKKSLSVLSGKKPNLTAYNRYSISTSRGESNVSTSPNHENENKSNLNTIGIKFNWNLFDGGLIKQQYISLKNRNEELMAEFNLSKEQIKRELLDTLIDLEISMKNIIFSFNQLKSAEETLSISIKRLKAGLTTQREIVNIQADVSEAETNFISSITKYNISLAQLERLTLLKKENICRFRKGKSSNSNNKFYEFINKNKLNTSCKNLD